MIRPLKKLRTKPGLSSLHLKFASHGEILSDLNLEFDTDFCIFDCKRLESSCKLRSHVRQVSSNDCYTNLRLSEEGIFLKKIHPRDAELSFARGGLFPREKVPSPRE